MSGNARIVDPKLRSLFDQMPGALGCKDQNSVYMYGNAEFGRVIGLPHHEDMIGRMDCEMPCDTANCADLFRAQDQKVMKKQERMKILDIHAFAEGQWKAYLSTKTPLFDEEKNIIGTIYHGVDITNTTTLGIGSLLTQFSIQGVKNDPL